MAHPRRFRFGVVVHRPLPDLDWAATARRVEDLGYDTLLVSDHFADQLAPIPAMMAAAAATTTLRVGSLVFDNDFRHPAALAKEIASVDVLCGGRVELGLGSGWLRTDYDSTGIAYDEPAVRVDRFEEGLHIIKSLLGPDPVTFEGRHYRIADLDGRPKPLQQPRPPILVGGGRRRMLSIAGREADIVGINPTMPNGVLDADAARSGTAEATDAKLAWVREAAGARYADLEINLRTYACVITDDRLSVAEAFAPLFDLTPEAMLAFPHALVGTVEEICESIRAQRDRWDASYIVVTEQELEAFAPVVERLAGT